MHFRGNEGGFINGDYYALSTMIAITESQSPVVVALLPIVKFTVKRYTAKGLIVD